MAHMPLVAALLVVWAPVSHRLFLLFFSLHQLLHQSGGGGGGGGGAAADLSYVLMRSLIDETATSGIIHQPALLLKAFKEHQNQFFFFPSACLLLLIFPSINLWA